MSDLVPPGAVPGLCPDCGAPLDMKVCRPFNEIDHLVYRNEWVSLEPFPVELFCTKCDYRVASVGRQFTIDLDKMVIVFGLIDRPRADG